jgi:UDP-N-acetylmuramoyl-tripeptide--D-alanyl-D-alanine ligase
MEMIGAVLSHPEAEGVVGPVGTTAKNMNDDTGLPMSVLLFDDPIPFSTYRGLAEFLLLPYRIARLAFARGYPKVLVLEYGTHWEGHLHRLARLAPPKVAVVTTVGPAHLDRLRTIEGVVHEKSAVVRPVPPDGLVVLGDGHGFVSQFERISQAPVVKVSGRGTELSRNIARVIGRYFGVSEATINSALAEFKGPEGRLTTFEAAGISVIDDSYNANPLSMRLGLDTLVDTTRPGQRRVAVLGGMAELGDDSTSYHEEIGAYARTRADVVIGVGDLAKAYSPDHWFADSRACAEEILSILYSGDHVLIKGSGSARMKTVVAKLRNLSASEHRRAIVTDGK